MSASPTTRRLTAKLGLVLPFPPPIPPLPPLPPSPSPADPWLAPDKAQHLAGCLLLTLLLWQAQPRSRRSASGLGRLASLLLPASLAFLLGLAKELADDLQLLPILRGAFSVRDLCADALGCLLAVLCLRLHQCLAARRKQRSESDARRLVFWPRRKEAKQAARGALQTLSELLAEAGEAIVHAPLPPPAPPKGEGKGEGKLELASALADCV
jgi:hypothetical protein